MSATRVAEPDLLARYPSASSWLKQSCTMPRDTPSSRASSREDGSRSPPRSRPLLIASRRPASSWARSGCPADRSIPSSSSGLKPDHSIAMESDLTSEPVAPYRRCYEHLDASRAGGGTKSPHRSRLVGLPLGLTFMAEFASLAGFLLLVSVMPMLADAAGAGSAAAGLITGALLGGTVIAEAAAAFAIRRFGYRVVLAAGALLLGAPTLALLPREPLAIMVAVSLVRGLGFGLCGVAAGALTALLLPPERRGEGLGLLGIVSGVPAIVALPAGVWLAGHHQATAAVAVAAIMGLMPLAALRWLPGGRPGSRPGGGPAASGRGALRLALVFAACTVAAGVVDSFLPLARGVPNGVASTALLVQAITATLSRWQAGRHGDRLGHARLLVPAVIASALGMGVLIWLASPAAMLAGLALFGPASAWPRTRRSRC